jgi:hypothetical protein
LRRGQQLHDFAYTLKSAPGANATHLFGDQNFNVMQCTLDDHEMNTWSISEEEWLGLHWLLFEKFPCNLRMGINIDVLLSLGV